MSRPLRIEFQSAWYHVMNRGRRREDIFLDKEDYRLFLEVLQGTSTMWNLKVSAYCLMSNHYHLLVQTPDGNLSRCMRHLNGVYAQRFNRKHDMDGQLFRGRYKAVLVEEGSYLLELLRYIHRNPLEAGMMQELEEWPWNSHRGYLANTKGWSWLHRDMLLRMFAKTREKAFTAYLAFVCQHDSEDIQQFYSRKNLPGVFGSTGFIDNIRNSFGELRREKETPEVAVLSVDSEVVKRVVCHVCQITEQQLLASKRGTTNIPRDLAIYALRLNSRKTLAEIGTDFEIDNYSTVSSAIDRAKKALISDPKVRRNFKSISLKLQKSQQQT